MGEVTITLDNADGALPLDFSEVTITRRVFRTGEGEYFINRVPCRLRDIHELLLDTGIGKHAYSMISQNEVDRLLSVRSEDRREIFEQAAGIQRYRQRKNEAMRKLDKVCDNLLRVNDIIHELETQLAPLAQQSEAAREYRASPRSCSTSSSACWWRSTRRSPRTWPAPATGKSSWRSEIETVAHPPAPTRGAGGGAAGAPAGVRGAAGSRPRPGRRGWAARPSGAEGRLNLTPQRIDDLKAQAHDRGSATSSTSPRSWPRPKESRGGRAAAAGDSTRGCGRSAPRWRCASRACASRLGEIKQAGSSVQEQRGEHLDLLRELADARNRLVQCESLIQAAESRVHRLQEQRDLPLAHREGVEHKARRRAALAEQVRAERDRLQTEVERAARGRGSRAHPGGDAGARGRADAGAPLRAFAPGLRALQEMERSREGLRAGVRAVLQAMDRGELRGEYRTVADLLRVPKELELAMESALGAAAGDIVVPTQAEASAAIDLPQAHPRRPRHLPAEDRHPPHPAAQQHGGARAPRPAAWAWRPI